MCRVGEGDGHCVEFFRCLRTEVAVYVMRVAKYGNMLMLIDKTKAWKRSCNRSVKSGDGGVKCLTEGRAVLNCLSKVGRDY